MNSEILALFQDLVRNYWAFLQEDWPVIENKMNHRSEIKNIPNIEIARNYVLEHLGVIPVFFFLTVLFSRKDFPGPYRGVEKGILILYHLLTGQTMLQMGQFIPKTTFNSLYFAFYWKQREWLEEQLDKCLSEMFSDVKIRVMCARNCNPNDFKHVTIMIDGHDTRAAYINAADRAQFYSYKLKKSGFRTQVGMDINGMILFVSAAAPCATNNDGSMLVSMGLDSKNVSRFDVVCMDGGYSLFLDRLVQVNPHLQKSNFVTPIRRSKGVNLSPDEASYNSVVGSFRSSIESRFGELGHLFQRFNGKSVIRVSDDTMFTVQLKLACVLSNIKKFVAMGQLQHTEHHMFWMQSGFDYYNGSDSSQSLYDVIDTLSILDRRVHKENMELMQQQLFSLSIADIVEGDVNASSVEDSSMGDDDEYEVERIIAHRHTSNGTLYKVKWIGYDNRHNRWLSRDKFGDGQMIEEYLIAQNEQ
jgi:hypothetical protein